MSRLSKNCIRLGLLLGSTALANPAFADTVAKTPPPVAESIDANGVDVLSGQYSPLTPKAQIGDAVNGIGLDRSILGKSYVDSWTSYIIDTGNSAAVTINGSSVSFTESNGVFTPIEQNGDTLVKDGSGYTYTTADGTAYRYSLDTTYYIAHFGTIFGSPLQTVTYPTGKKLTFYYTAASFSGTSGQDVGLRLQAVKSNTGYEVHLAYAHPDVTAQGDEAPWSDAILVYALNSLVDPCPVTANDCTNTTGYPMFAASPQTQTQKDYADAKGNQTNFTIDGLGNITGVAPPGATNNAVIAYNAAFGATNYAVSSVTNARGTTNYTYSVSGNIGTVVATNGSSSRTYRVDMANKHVLAVIDELNHETDYQYDSGQRLIQITYPRGNYDVFGYDARGNLTSTTRHPVPGSAMANIVTSAIYPSSCTNAVTCNKPTSTTDANGHNTYYNYDSVHGGLTSLTESIDGGVAFGGKRVTNYSYTQIDVNGSPSSSGVWVVSKIAVCTNNNSCAGTAQEKVTTFAYGQNYRPVTITTAAGDGSISSTQTLSYDKFGNVTANDGPLAGTADTTYFQYDANRQLTATVMPDPDGAGVLKQRATRVTYSPRNLVTRVEVGTVASPSNADIAAMSVLQQADTAYDNYGRKISDTFSSGGTTYSITQYNYDALSRLKCSATRMNLASLPSDACTAGTLGSNGPDRIAQNGYNAVDQLTSVTTGLGTSAAETVNYSYTVSGKQQSFSDGKNNKTTYVYDDFDRLYQLQHPSPTTPGTSSTTDYEQYSYDNNGNVTTRRVRNGSTITYAYDYLNRVTTKTPSSTSNPTLTFQYDRLDHLTQATATTSATNHTLTDYFTYDALGRKLTDEGRLDGTSAGVKTMQYDAASRRTRLTWSDGLYFTYDYDNLGEMTGIHENGGTKIEGFVYDDLGRRTSRTASNGTSQGYSYTGPNLTGLTLSGGGNPASITIGGYNPAGQLLSRTVDNTAYSWNAAANANRGYSTDGQNKYTAIAGVTQTYDPKGNLTSSGGLSYTYGIENTMTTGGSANFLYDALGRLVNSSGGVRFDYDGDQIVGENTVSGGLLRRYALGPSQDEPLVWYEGAGTATKRFLDADERGSVVRVTDTSGTAITINTYDEYGIPGTANSGRFQYTGQAWMPEVGLYYYKARMYSPQLGRFMQPDPLGLKAGQNLYNYTTSDPVNLADPLGLDDDEVVITGHRSGGWWGVIEGSSTLTTLIINPLEDALRRRAEQAKARARAFSDCARRSLGKPKNIAILTADLVAAGASFIPGGKGTVSAVAAVVGSYAGIGTLGLGVITGDKVSMVTGPAAHYTSAAAFILDGAKGLAENLTPLGKALAIGQIGWDVRQALKEDKCI